MANVKVRLKDASNNVLHPETDWSVVLNKPSIKLQYTDGEYGTGADSKINAVTRMVGVGEAWDTYSNGDTSIVIGNSDNALGFYGAKSKNYFTVLQSKQSILIAAEGNISIRSSATGDDSVALANYPINWTALNDRPFDEFLNLKNYDGSSVAQSSIENAVFGTYSFVDTSAGSITTTFYPAFAIVSQRIGLVGGGISQAERTKGYYLNASGALIEITDMKNFKGLLDYRKNNQ